MQPESQEMHERLTVLEQNHKNVLSRIDNVENSVGVLSIKIDKVIEFIQEAKGKQLPPIQTIIVTAVATFTLISMVIGAVYWVIDTRVGQGVARANSFVSQMADGPNNIFVQLHDHEMRLRRFEADRPK